MSHGQAGLMFAALVGIWIFTMVSMFRLGDIRDELRALRRQGNRR